MAEATNTEEIVALLESDAKRLNESVGRATALHATFTTLNNSLSKNDYEIIGPLAGTLNLIQTSLLQEMILIVVRLLDHPRNLRKNEKVSFKAVDQWLANEAVRASIIERARQRHGEEWERRSQVKTRLGIRRINRNLRRLKDEDPNREKLLRDFRNDFLAHELEHPIPNDLPELGHLIGMLSEIKILAFQTLYVCTGFEIGFDHIEAEAREGAEQLLRSISERKFRWHPKLGVVPK